MQLQTAQYDGELLTRRYMRHARYPVYLIFIFYIFAVQSEWVMSENNFSAFNLKINAELFFNFNSK